MGYELYRLLATVTPSMSSSKSMPPTKKKKSPIPDKVNGEPEVIDLDEEEKHMELLIGRYIFVRKESRTQCGQVVVVSELKSRGPRIKSCHDGLASLQCRHFQGECCNLGLS